MKFTMKVLVFLAGALVGWYVRGVNDEIELGEQ
jgi:hypothetical protein